MASRLLAGIIVTLTLACSAQNAGALRPAPAVFDRSAVTVLEEGEYVSVSIDGTRCLGKAGTPALPVEVRQFVIPSDMRVEDIVISALSEEQLPGVYRILPVQPEVPIGETPQWADPDPTIYEKDELYPPRRIEYLGDGYLGGYRIASVAIYPLRYNPVQGKLVLATELSFDLSLAAGADRSLPRERITSRSDALYRKLVRSVVSNPEDLGVALRRRANVVEDVGPEGFAPRYTPSLEGSPVEYVIITNETLEPYFQEFADWKTKKGVPTVVKTVSWIDSSYPGGCDTPERIRMFIRDAYTTWGTTYVLIGGDTNIVPIRIAWTSYYNGAWLPTDLYYSDLDDNWDWDGDHLFGEAYGGPLCPGDSLDLYPDVFVGRAPAANGIEAETFVDKTFTYVKSPTDYFTTRNLYMAEVLFPYDWEPGMGIHTDGAEHVVEPVLPLVPAHIHNVRLYQNWEPFPGSFPLDREAALDSLNLGYNVVSHVGHGNKDVMRVSKHNYINMPDVDDLTNGAEKSGFMWLLNCTSTAIEKDCIAEHCMNNPDGGSSSLFGPTHYAFPTTTKDYYYSWFEDLYSMDITRAGVVCATCKIPYVPACWYANAHIWTQHTLVYLGDPEMYIWTDRPVSMNVTHAPTVQLGTTGIIVSVTDPAPVDSAFVCVAKAGEVYARGHTDPTGQLNLPLNPLTTGQMTVTVSAENHTPYEGTINVTSTSSAHLSLRAVDVDDDTSGLSDGNSNGRPEAGESVELDITVGNGGSSEATGVNAVLTCSDPYIDLLDDSEYLGTIPAFSQVEFDAAFAISIDADCPNEYEVPLTAGFIDGSESTWVTNFNLKVYRPDLVQLHNDVDDSQGNGNSIPEVGETVVLTIEVLNEGNGDADLVAGILRYPSSDVTVTDSTDTWGNIPEGCSVVAQTGFEFTVNSTITQMFELELTDEDGKVWTHHFDLTPPGQPTDLAGLVNGRTIYLSWTPLTDPDLWGYSIYRSEQQSGPFGAVSDGITDRIAYFEDAGLEENTIYYYYVTGVDTSGNEGVESSTLTISTNPPSQQGWPLPADWPIYGTPAVVDMDLDGDLELLVGSGNIHCWHHDGMEYRDGDGDPRTNGVYEIDGQGGYRASIAVGQMDNDEYPEMVVPAFGNVGTPEEPIYEVHAWNVEDASPLDGWPVTTAHKCWATPALGDLSGDGLPEVLLPCSDGWLYCWRPDGTELMDGDNNPATIGPFVRLRHMWAYGSPVIVDIDHDAELEVIVPSRSDSIYCLNPDGSDVPGWPAYVAGQAVSSPCVGDLNNDGQLEVVAHTNEGDVWVLDESGNVMGGWPKNIGAADNDFPPSPAIADVNADGDLEIVMGATNGFVWIWDWEGNDLPGWPVSMDASSHSSAAVGDVDGDPGMEIVIGCNSGKVYAYDSDGSILAGWPIQTGDEIYSTPTLIDFDDDGDVEVIVTAYDNMVYIWDSEGNYAGGDNTPWMTFRHDFWRTGYFGYEEPVEVPGDTPTFAGAALLSQNFPNPFNPTTTVSFAFAESVSDMELAVYNVSGERVRTLLKGPASPGEHSVCWNGRDEAGAPVASGVYFVRLDIGGESHSRKMVLLK